MTDRELLELAAKAAGLNYSPEYGCVFNDEYPQGVDWNPLHDDGDALRLAVRIVQLTSFYRFMKACIQAFRTEEHFSTDDGCLPTRRAITRAAAEIGKTIA